MEEISSSIAESANHNVEENSERIDMLPDIDDVEAIELLLKQQGSPSLSLDENGLMMAWNELRTSLRQLHRTIIPSAQNNKWQNSLKTKPSVSRIKYLSNMLLNHDPHQLFIKLSQLSQELCIELKVRLLTTVNDAPTAVDSKAFIHGMCESYQWVMSICEAAQNALEKLDTDHLSLFGLNWISVNMHAFYTTVFTDPDVQDYLTVCSGKLTKVPDCETLECLTSLQKTLVVAEELWSRAEINLHRYTQQIGPHRRSDDGGCNHAYAHSSDVKPVPVNVTQVKDSSTVQCPCRSCMSEVDSKAAVTQVMSVEELKNNTSKPCDCHFCNASKIPSTPAGGASCGGSLPPISQPQLSLYPHIHGTSTDMVSTQSLEDLMRSSTASTKPPPIPSHLLGSDVLTQQLLREWETAYGDAISPPSSRPFTTAPSFNRIGDQTGLANGLQNLSLDKHPPDSSPDANFFRLNNISSVIPNSLLTTAVSSHTSSVTTTSCGFAPISTLNGTENGPVSRDVDHRAMNGTAGVITHTKYSVASNHQALCDHRGCRQQRSDETSTSRESSSVCDSSGGDEEDGMTSEDYEQYSTEESSEEHPESHCDCCYCHLLEGQQGGGRQRYNDRRERLLKILARKKATVSSSSSSNTSNAPVATSAPQTTSGHEDINQIMNYIEGSRMETRPVREKKAPAIVKKQQKKKKDLPTRPKTVRQKKKSTSEEEDGPLAELRRRAPDVTITVVKPGERPPPMEKMPQRSQLSISRNSNNREGDPHPLMVRPQQGSTPEMWIPPTSRIGTNLGQMGMPSDSNYTAENFRTSLHSQNGDHSQGSSINNLIKNMQPAGRSKEKDGSQMVAIKRVMDPVTADPRVTITLKGAEKKNDVLLQLINGQAMARGKGGNKVDHEPYEMPEGLTGEEAKKYKKRLQKERRRRRKQDELKQEAEEDQMQQLHLQKQQQQLLQQEKQIKQQQVALQRQQQELLRQQQQKNGITPKGSGGKKVRPQDRKGGGGKKNGKVRSPDMSKNYTLPPGVSINKVAGQPGMVTISNNLGGPQPFLSNPNVFANSFAGGYRQPSGPAFPSNSMATPYSYGPTWNESGSTKDNVIVVDTKANSTKKETRPNPSKKDKQNPPKKDTKANLPKKDSKTNNSKASNSSQKDAKVKQNPMKKDVKLKVSPLKKDVKLKVNVAKKDIKNNCPAKKDAKLNCHGKKDAQKVKLPAKKKAEDMTPEERFAGALAGEVETSYLTKAQRKKLKKRIAVRERHEAERREEDELMDKMYKISLSNGRPEKNPTKKLKQVVETVGGKKQLQKGNQANGSVVKRLQKPAGQLVKLEGPKTKVAKTADKSRENVAKSHAKKVDEPKRPPATTKESNKKSEPVKQKPEQAKQKPEQAKQKPEPAKQKPEQAKQKPDSAKQKPEPAKQQPVKTVPKMVIKLPAGPIVTRKQQIANSKNQMAQQAVATVKTDGPRVTKKVIPPKNTTHQPKEDETVVKKQKGKATKKNSLDDMAIDNIFTPKSHDANLDPADREVEAFKRFCFENAKRNNKEKLKINFNVKDIMITKKYGLY